ncbi:hypothetical protein G9A89_010380 [Geosiphon pyriformis]|nr:hypothetical protein G9A89_010380 [Geosiphon pyriformis]
MPLGFQSLPHQPDFRTASLWKITESEKKEEKETTSTTTIKTTNGMRTNHKARKISGKEDDTQMWINDVVKAITTNNWNDTRAF